VKYHRAEVRIDIEASLAPKLIIVIPNEDISGYVKELRREYSFFTKCFDDKTLMLVTIPWINAYIENKRNKKMYVVDPDKYKEIESSSISPISPISKNPERLIENSKTNENEKALENIARKQQQNIEEHINKLRNEPNLQKKFFLMDTNICMHNVHEKEEQIEISRLLSICGAFLYESFIPGITTHIITHHPDKELIGKAGSLDNSTGPFVVTKQWLIDSIISENRVNEKEYLPTSMNKISSSTFKTLTLEKRASKPINGKVFKNTSFSIITDSYTPQEVKEITEKIETNSGNVISEHVENSLAKYIIVNDGHHSWTGFKLEKDENNRYTVSHRFIDR